MSSTHTPSTAAPSTVTASFWLYVVGAILGIVGAIVLVAILPSQLAAGQDRLNEALQGRSTNGVDVNGIASGALIGGAVFSVVLTVVFSVLTLVVARMMRRGRNWARIVLAVIAGLQLFGVAGTYGAGAVHFLVMLAAAILSFLPASNAWFRAMRPDATTAV